jgi:hypothetical protein
MWLVARRRRRRNLAWCKKRALEYVDADLTHAVDNMASDLKTHPDTDNPALNGLVMIGMQSSILEVDVLAGVTVLFGVGSMSPHHGGQG